MPNARLAPRLAALPLLLCAGCVVDDADRRPGVALRGEVASMFVHRGMPQNEHGVAQGTMTTLLPMKSGGDVALTAFANVDLSDDVGDAWFDDGHGGRVSEFDLVGAYRHQVGDVVLEGGLHDYNFPFGESFPGGPRTSTTELFARAAAEVLGATPFVEYRYDFDQADGSYVRAGVDESIALAEQWALLLNGHVGWSSASQSFWNYGLRASGFADLQVGATLQYALDDATTLGATVQGSTILDDGIADWFDVLGVDSNNVWVGVFVELSY